MKPTTLRFFNELDEAHLAATFSDHTVNQLGSLGAGVTMGLLDRSAARARLIRRLADDGVPVGAWLLLPRNEGYFATHQNFERIEALVDDTVRWAEAEALPFEALGLDFEPALTQLEAFMQRPVLTGAQWVWSARHRAGWQRALTAYRHIVSRIRDAGFRTESYQFPLLLADRRSGGSLWQRIAGGLEVSVDREVVMLYTSLLGVPGPGLVERLAPSCRAIGLGSTGGGIDPYPKLTWSQLERDLLLASAACTDLSIFSLEGCVEHGHLERLREFDWSAHVDVPMRSRVSSELLSGACAGLSFITRAL